MTKSVADNIGRVPATQVKKNGPRTARGKVASSKNARKHGLTSKDVVLPGESAKEFEHFRNEIVADQDYSLIIPDFLFGDRDGYTMPRSARESATPPATVLQYLVLDAIIKSQAKGETVGAKVDPANPRFVELVSTRGQCWTEG